MGEEEERAMSLRISGYNKYGNRKTEVDGILFDSAKEAQRYKELRLLEAAGEIKGLRIKPSWRLIVNGETIGKFTADFDYYKILHTVPTRYIVEDVKPDPDSRTGKRPPLSRDYILRKKLMHALFGITITEV